MPENLVWFADTGLCMTDIGAVMIEDSEGLFEATCLFEEIAKLLTDSFLVFKCREETRRA
jgi:hypothetical protein